MTGPAPGGAGPSGTPGADARAQAGGADALAATAPSAAQDQRNRTDGAPSRPNALVRLWRVAALPVLSILFAMLLGGVLMLVSPVVSGRPFDPTIPITAYGALVEGSIGKPELWAAGNFNALSNTLVQAAPLILGGLAVGLAFKAGLFNIGVAGQFLMGAFTAAVVGARLGATMDTNFAVPVTLVAAALVGGVYGFIPGFLKARTGAHEVVTTIMLNNIAVLLLGWAVADFFRSPDFSFARTADIANAKLPILFGRNVHLGVALAFASVFVVKFLLDRTTLGFEIRTVGANPNAARYAGIRPVFIIALTMTLAGLLSGLAGGIQILGVIGFYSSGISANVGFDAITVALLGRSSPLGIMGAALLFGAFRAGQGLMQINTNGLVPIEVIDVIQALIILFLAADIIIRKVFRLRAAKGSIEGEVRTVTQSWTEQIAR
jgi:general nucleoside transport system permease protein